MTMHLYTDGACSGNPGKGGWAVIKFNPLTQKADEAKYGASEHTTNNAMELRALIEAMAWAKEYAGDRVRIYSDSSYAVKGVKEWMQGWAKRGWRKADGKPILNPTLWLEIYELWDPSKMTLTHVYGHNGDKGNELADQWAVAAKDGKI